MHSITLYNQNSENESLPQIFDFNGYKIRVVVDKCGEPWFLSTDVAEVLGYHKTNHATRLLDDDERNAHIVGTPGGPQKLSTVNESGLYSLIFASRKAEARRFKKWVTSDVLPTIRKTGSYGQQVDLNDTKLLHKLLLNYTDRVVQLEGKLTNDQPKINFYDDFINSEGLYNLQNAARALNCHPNLFINSLKNHYLFYQNKVLLPYQIYRDQGLFVVKSNIIDNQARCQTYITSKGLRYFAEHTYVKQTNNDNRNYQLTQSTIINNQFMEK